MSRLGGLLALILLFGGGWLVLDGAVAPGVPFAGSPGDDPTTSAPSDEPSDEPSDGPDDESGCDPSPGRVVADYLYGQGFKKRDFVVGAQVIDWGRLDTGHTRDPFSETLKSEASVVTFLSSDAPASRKARNIAGIADDYVPVQFEKAIRYSDNWYWTGHKAVKGGDRMVRSGDVWWLAINDDCEVVEKSSVRAICGNVGVYWLRPAIDPRD